MQMLMPVTEETQRLVDWVDKGANLEACMHVCAGMIVHIAPHSGMRVVACQSPAVLHSVVFPIFGQGNPVENAAGVTEALERKHLKVRP